MKRELYTYNDARNVRRFFWATLVLVFFLTIGPIFAEQAFAQVGMGNFSCANGTATGNLFSADIMVTSVDNGIAVTATSGSATGAGSGPCNNPALGVFGRLLCFFKSTVGQVMSTMYCSFQYSLQGPLQAALTLFVVVFGIGVVTGIIQFTLKEAFIAFVKITLIWMFATHAEWGIGIAYQFFMGVGEEGANIVLNAFTSTCPTCAAPSLYAPDTILANFFTLSTSGTASATGGTGSSVIPSIPTLTPFCATMMGFTALFLTLLMPVVAGFVAMMIFLYIALYARAILGYLTALVLISFLFILSPLFISFALFRTTLPLFQQWIKYLTSFAIQMIIVFAFLALLQMVPLGAFFTQILGLIREYDVTFNKWYLPHSIHTCSFCTYTLNTTSTPNTVACNTGGAGVGGTQPSWAVPAVGPTGSPTGGYVIPLLNLFSAHDLMQFIASQTIALWLIGHVMADFLKKSQELARQLGGAPNVAAIGGGLTPEGVGINHIGVESIRAGFQKMTNQVRYGRDPSSNKIQSGALAGMRNPFKRQGLRDRFSGLGGTFMSGLLYGAEESNDRNVQERAIQMKKTEQRLASMKKRLDGASNRSEEQNRALQRKYDVEKERLGLLKQQQTTLRGILGSAEYDKDGKRLEGFLAAGTLMEGLSGHAKNEDIMHQIAEKRQERLGFTHKGNSNEYYLMKMPDDVQAHDEAQAAANAAQGTSSDGSSSTGGGLDDKLRDEAQSRIKTLQNQLAFASHSLSADQLKHIQDGVSGASGALMTADSSESLESIIRTLDALERQMG